MSKPSPWTQWDRAASRQFRFKVDTSPEVQAKAWEMVERGACAYQNRQGLLVDLGVPKKTKHRGRVFAFTEEATNESEAA